MLERLLREELAGIEALKRVLQQEFDALRTRDVAALERLANEKQACAEQLHRLGEARVAYLQQQGFSTDRGGLCSCIEAFSNAKQKIVMRHLLVELEQAAEQARDQNEVNGTVIATSRSQIEHLLALLVGRDPNEFLYGQDRRKVYSGGSGHSIAKV